MRHSQLPMMRSAAILVACSEHDGISSRSLPDDSPASRSRFFFPANTEEWRRHQWHCMRGCVHTRRMHSSLQLGGLASLMDVAPEKK